MGECGGGVVLRVVSVVLSAWSVVVSVRRVLVSAWCEAVVCSHNRGAGGRPSASSLGP